MSTNLTLNPAFKGASADDTKVKADTVTVSGGIITAITAP